MLYTTASGFALGKWVGSQRTAYKKGQLTPERIQRLDDLGFVWDVLTEQWEQGFRELASFKVANNHCRVPQSCKTASGFTLGNWVSQQIRFYNKGQLTPERLKRLDDLGFVWDAQKWEQGFSELTIFKDEHLHCLVHAHHKTASGFALGVWASRQRTAYRKDQLTPERIQRLYDMGFVWAPLTEKWEQGFSELAIFKDENNHCLVPRVHKTASGFTLGNWVSQQIRFYKKGQLTPERLKRLDDLGFVWDPIGAQWEQGFSELANYKDANNHCLVPKRYKAASGFKLGSWIANQRKAYNQDQLTPEQIQRFDDLGFVWNAR